MASSPKSEPGSGEAHVVYVDDNGRYQDTDARYKAGEYSSYAAALARCKQIVDACLDEYGRTAEGLAVYRRFGDDPFIVGPQPEAPEFSAWAYAASQCRE